ncbi:hypothetical protein C8Q79DRAFT_1010084 [Trametes meyenii]|nr:hypothetical protein C8Q79DRAFT_1010084 [Trametes meyenii]
MFGIGNNFADVVPTAATIRTTGLSSAMALTFLAWDIFTSFSDEVQLIWQASNGWFRWLYAFIRYVPLLTEIGRCAGGTLTEAVLMEFIIVAVEVVLLIRVYALYGRSKRVLLALLTGLAGSVCVTVFGMYFAANGFVYDGQCLVAASTRIVLIVWLSPVAFELVLLGLSLFKFGESRRQGLGKRPILDTLIRDGTWAFLSSLVVMVINAASYTIYSNELSSIF